MGPVDWWAGFPYPTYTVVAPGEAGEETRSAYLIARKVAAIRVQTTSTDVLYYPHTDHLGSTLEMTDENGTDIAGATTHHLPYGDYRKTPSAPISDRGYTGHRENMSEVGLVYMRARWFAPGLGRFLSADTIVPEPGNPQAYNRYSYVSGNPLKLIDPSGHEICESLEDPSCGEDAAPLPFVLPDSPGMPVNPWPWPIDFMIVEAAVLYGIPVEILSGVIYSEMRLDTDLTDFLGDAIIAVYPSIVDYVNVGPGIGNIHLSTARTIATYFDEHYGAGMSLNIGADESDASLASRLLDPEYSIQVAAAYVRMLADYRFGSNDHPLTESHADLSLWTLDDGLAVWHGYRFGVKDVSPGGQGFESIADFQNRTQALSVVATGTGAQASINSAIQFFCIRSWTPACD